MASSNENSNNYRNFSNVIQPLLLDKYQISMCYAYWIDGQHNTNSTFELYFRKNPFKGEFTVFAGLDECLRFIQSYKLSSTDINYLRNMSDYAHIQDDFWTYLSNIDTKSVKVYSLAEGEVCFPNIPLLRLDGPIAILQLLETPLLTLTNYASLITTNAVRYRLALNAGSRMKNRCNLLEFGLRRAQGPDGGFSASRYAYLGGFDGTSNLLAGRVFNIPVSGTMAHSYIISYSRLSQSADVAESGMLLNNKSNVEENFSERCGFFEKDLDSKNILGAESKIHAPQKSELKAFMTYAVAFPNKFLALVDSYDVIKSGLINFTIVSLALIDFGYKPIGIRIDSGDLAYLSTYSKNLFDRISRAYGLEEFKTLEIVASNDINEETIISLNDQQHSITTLGIGTHLVTCQGQPALGCVYKLVESDGHPCMKLSATSEKTSLPGKKLVYRLFGRDGHALIDLITLGDEKPPEVGKRILCCHPFLEEKRANVTPTRVEPLLKVWWDGKLTSNLTTNLQDSRKLCMQTMENFTDDIKRFHNPTPYKVSVSIALWNMLKKLKLELTPVGELA